MTQQIGRSFVTEYDVHDARDLQNLPKIGTKWIHKGGNVWEVVRLVYRYVNINGKELDRGIHANMVCLANKKVATAFPMAEFGSDFHGQWFH